jgi:hypothetical protein
VHSDGSPGVLALPGIAAAFQTEHQPAVHH